VSDNRSDRPTSVPSDDDGWYWDLVRRVAVPAAERGPGAQMLGPYASRAEAENWAERVEQRNEGWDDADEAWEQGTAE
jgi:hypothetical protein